MEIENGYRGCTIGTNMHMKIENGYKCTYYLINEEWREWHRQLQTQHWLQKTLMAPVAKRGNFHKRIWWSRNRGGAAVEEEQQWRIVLQEMESMRLKRQWRIYIWKHEMKEMLDGPTTNRGYSYERRIWWSSYEGREAKEEEQLRRMEKSHGRQRSGNRRWKHEMKKKFGERWRSSNREELGHSHEKNVKIE